MHYGEMPDVYLCELVCVPEKHVQKDPVLLFSGRIGQSTSPFQSARTRMPSCAVALVTNKGDRTQILTVGRVLSSPLTRLKLHARLCGRYPEGLGML